MEPRPNLRKGAAYANGRSIGPPREVAWKGACMDRKEFLRSVCGLGVCGCALGVLETAGAAQPADTAPEDQRLLFARYQLSKLLGFMAADVSAEACTAVLEKTGRECARLGQLGQQFKGNPEGYFAAARQNWGTDFTWDREKGTVTVAVADGPCGHRLKTVLRRADIRRAEFERRARHIGAAALRRHLALEAVLDAGDDRHP